MTARKAGGRPFDDCHVPMVSLSAAAEIKLGKMIDSVGKPGQRKVPYIKAANIRKEGVATGDLDLMWATQEDVSRLNVRRGDLFVIEGGATAGRVAVVTEMPPPGTVFQNSAHRVRARGGTDQRFLYYVLFALAASGWYDAICSTATFKHLTSEKMKALSIPFPAHAVQRAIGAFLDRETSQIDGLISNKGHLTSLLNERHAALTSSLLWNGSPHPYEIRRLKHLTGFPTSGNRDHASFTFSDSGVPCLRGLNVRPGTIDTRNLLRISYEDHLRHATTALQPGDVVIVRSGLAGSAVAIPASFGQCNCVDLVVVRRSKSLHPKYLEYVVNSREAQEQVATEQSGALLKHFNAVDVGELRIPYRSWDEQVAIVRVLDEQSHRKAAAVERLQRQVALLQEHRQALITAAVTGQIDVSAAA